MLVFKTKQIIGSAFVRRQHTAQAMIPALSRSFFMASQHTNITMMATQRHQVSVLGAHSQRMFFGGKNKKQKEEKKEEVKTEEKKEEPAATSTEEETASAKEEVKEETEKKSDTETESEEDETLSKKDVKRIKQLFNEQEVEIAGLEKEIESVKELLKKQETETKKYQIEYTRQVRENEDTVKRYRKMIDDEKQFAITKFAKDLLEVRDAIRLALEHTNHDTIKAVEEVEKLKEQFEANLDGQVMTADVMDKVLSRFNVESYDPKGDKFDPKLHEAVFTVADPKMDNDTVAIVMQTGWKIGEDRILRAAKVGIVKK